MKEPVRYRRDLWRAVKVKGDSAEIGVAEGNFSEEILSWPVHFPRHYMVDRWKNVQVAGDSSMPQAWHEGNFKKVIQRMERFVGRAVFLRGESVQQARHVPDKSLAFLYIDGDHSYDGVWSDINAWLPKLKPGGLIAFHDFENSDYGVKHAVTDFLRYYNAELHLLPEDKPEDAGAFFYVNH